MTAHRAVIEAGPAVVRLLCCGTDKMSAEAAAALDAVDDPVALVDEKPVAVGALWSQTLRALAGGHRGVVVVHPTWWPAVRVGVITTAAGTLAEAHVAVRPRSWLLAAEATVEIAERLVAIIAPEVVAVPRRADPDGDAERVLAAIPAGAPVLIDAPGSIAGAARLARLIAHACDARVIDDAGLRRLARASAARDDDPARPHRPSRVPAVARLAAASVVVTLAGVALSAVATERPGPAHLAGTAPTTVPSAGPAPGGGTAPTTVLVEGRVAVMIPANWVTQRVVAGPGSARVQVTSPLDPEVALHLTQSQTPGETLTGAADRLRRAIDAEPAGVFVDFNPADVSTGRSAVTYREVRAAHQVRWTVWLDGSVRISLGCQSRPDAPDAVRDACDQALRTAHAAG